MPAPKKAVSRRIGDDAVKTMVAVTYEQERGLRDKHQKPDGYEISRSKTITAPIANVYSAWNEKSKGPRWLAEPLEIRTATRTNRCASLGAAAKAASA
jgi:hypothetical protein